MLALAVLYPERRNPGKNGRERDERRKEGFGMITDSYTFDEWLRLWRDNVRREIKNPPEGKRTKDDACRREGRLQVLEAAYERFVEQVQKGGAA